MFSHLKHRGKLIGLLSLMVAIVWMPPAIVHGQAGASAQPTILAQFAGIDQSLTRRADNLLVSVDQPLFPANGETQDYKASNDLAISWDQPLGSRKSGALSLAAARVELLRPTIEPILRREGVPPELSAIVFVESGGRSAALSSKGARGLWQLMPETARRYGLVVDGVRDERLDINKSTYAAARYLSELHQQFGTWPLAIAAYNTGEQNVQRAIDRIRSREFKVLSSSGLLPLETRSYVPAVMAAIRSSGSVSFPEELPR